jgi:peptide chain release factor 1
MNGYKEAIIMISGRNVFGKLKYESGVHRVQRVPETESGGRIHTSAVSVAVLPEREEVEIEINPDDLKIDFFSASGPGGQHVNKASTAVRIEHIPSGIIVSCQDERSQYQNRVKAMKILRTRLYDMEKSKKDRERESSRKKMIGSGDRSEKIRTYNFPQNRITDHRINYTKYNLDSVMNGNLDNLIESLQAAEQRI